MCVRFPPVHGGAGPPNENVCWLVPHQECSKPRYKSPFAAKVKWDNLIAKNGCCRTIGPPPHFNCSCPEHFLRKHTRNEPVFFSREDLKSDKCRNEQESQFQRCCFNGKPIPPLDTGLPLHRASKTEGDCPFAKPPSRMGLFRGPKEESYENKYRNYRRARYCPCDEDCGGEGEDQQATNKENKDKELKKDFIRSNALKAIRMPPRRKKRCYYVNDMHLVDMSDSPYVLRPGFGKVPPYIYKRKLELIEDDVRFKNTKATEASDDFYAVQHMEKEQVLNGLKHHLENLVRQYHCFPVNDNTNRAREAKEDLEMRIREVEHDIKLLNLCGPLYVGDVNKAHYI